MFQCRVKHTLSLAFSKGNPSRLLSLLASTVEAHSGTVMKDPQKFSLQACFQERPAPHESAGLPDEVPQASGDVKREGNSLSGPQRPAAVFLSDSQEQPNNRPVKKQRTSSAHGENNGRRQSTVKMTMTLRQESAGSFVVLAALQQEQVADTAAAAAFTAKCHAIQQDIEQLISSMQ